ncbi:MAG: nickel pincer cofactor biosynthesis protein LarB [Magnetococcales bacterium]|nr:nickel pincer cofactor biosynthesis protein LarB [Magnetococcales bacterium]
MSPDRMKQLLTAVASGETSVEEACAIFRHFPMDELKESGQVIARLDTHRRFRHGFAEVILAEGKQFEHLRQVVARSLEHGNDFLVTRISPNRSLRLKALFPQLIHAQTARCLYYQKNQDLPGIGKVVVLCAGTSDINVAEEAVITARLMGAHVETYYDAGVAGLHRLLSADDLLRSGRVFIVVAGMEGALPSVVGGLVDKPIIAVPTSIGYGASLGGIAALLGMLNSCASNVTVVNIDNGFGAGYVAAMINRLGQVEGSDRVESDEKSRTDSSFAVSLTPPDPDILL